ncbi:MAG: PQQ-binding-like beta-propeller repeat protein [Kiritimatiellae bacterium]|nr:PQQ-binding-like beta-propeller repeat protein [Kiritimatiellia bacterium]
MTAQRLTHVGLTVAFGAACAVALAVALAGFREGRATTGQTAAARAMPLTTWRVAWRARMEARPNAPAALFPEGWVVTDEAGGVTSLSGKGGRVWRTVLSNRVFEASASVSKELVVVASLEGRVTALRTGTGEVVWSVATGARFQHQPLIGSSLEGEEVVRLVSQADGRLFCLRLADGKTVWQGEATNRCDGEPAVWEEHIAYGNCDGAVYVFDAANGALKGSVKVGEDDQMAGGMLAAGAGLLVAGTRQGNLVVVNAATQTSAARVKVSSDEAFLKPALAFGGLIAMGTREGDVTFWQFDGKGLQPKGRVPPGASVEQVCACGDRLFVLSGGALRVMDAVDGEPVKVPLGDEVYGLTARCRCSVACVADGAVVCVKGEAHE